MFTIDKKQAVSVKRGLVGFCSMLAMLSAAGVAQAIDVDAGDYVPAPAGTNVGLLYLQHASRDALYAQGNRVAGNNGLDSDIGILRLVHFMEIGGMIADPQILLPFGRLKGTGAMAGTLGSEDGIGDPILAATFWVQNNPQAKTYTGITPYVYVPIGSYNSQRALNLGENRWRYSLQAAHVRPLGEKFSLDLVGDVTLFGKNDEYGAANQTLKQKPLYQAQAWLRYHLTPTSDIRLGVSETFGGRSKIDGVEQDDRKSTSKFSLGGSFFIAPKTQIVGLIGRDISVRDGFRESSRINIRILQVF